MEIPPQINKNSEIVKNIQRVENCKSIIQKIPLEKEVIINLRRKSILKSALYSARIEGNPLTFNEFSQSSPTSQKVKIKEGQNIIKAVNYVFERYENSPNEIRTDSVLRLHKIIMEGVSEYPTGKFRNEISALFNESGQAVYVAPSPELANTLLGKLFAYLNNEKDEALIKAFAGQYIFEKIHPFFDGNGRVGRLLTTAVLAKSGYGMKGLLSFEELLDEKRSLYYNALDENVQFFTEFMLEMYAKTCEDTVEKLIEQREGKITEEDRLLPRRLEILNIIKDHNLVNFDFIQRRFLSINPRTLRYDLKHLVEKGFVVKKGATKGVFYAPTAKHA